MTERVYTIIGTDRNPDITDGIGLAMELGLKPREISATMGRDAFEIFIPYDENAAIESTRVVAETLAKFTDPPLNYTCEEKQ